MSDPNPKLLAQRDALLIALQRLLDAPEQMEWGEAAANVTERSAARALAQATIDTVENAKKFGS